MGWNQFSNFQPLYFTQSILLTDFICHFSFSFCFFFLFPAHVRLSLSFFLHVRIEKIRQKRHKCFFSFVRVTRWFSGNLLYWNIREWWMFTTAIFGTWTFTSCELQPNSKIENGVNEFANANLRQYQKSSAVAARPMCVLA